MRIKRYASHYLLLPEYGFLKQHAIEIRGECVVRVFPFSGEPEDMAWYPGVILLSGEKADKTQITHLFQFPYNLLSELPGIFQTNVPIQRVVYLLYPFDFDKMTVSEVTEISRIG
ncbi:hypothetical protein EZS27_002854 [termite gut metagenome]|uniref:Uncharacterized protein n=1 Tax=termite gut metagenome TaxID=433724 RepID=A0A5J4SWD4_9ZZZZ